MAEASAAKFYAGQIVIADWRAGALPREANKLRPAIVVEDDQLFAAEYENVVLVPLTGDPALIIPDLAVVIEPNAENGCHKPCWAVSNFVTATSKTRLTPTPSRITAAQLAAIRRQIALTVGVEA